MKRRTSEENGGWKRGRLADKPHIGNFEMAGICSKDWRQPLIYMVDQNTKKTGLSLFSEKRIFNVNIIKEDNSHIYQINKAFNEKQIVCIHGEDL